MSVGGAVHWKLKNDADVFAVVGENIWPDASPNNEYPCLTYTLTDETENYLDGSPSSERYTLVIECEARSSAAVAALATKVKAALNKQKGTWNGVVVRGCNYKPSETEETVGQDGPHTRFYGITQQYTLRVI